MVLTRFAGTALVLMAGGLALGGARDAHALGAGIAMSSISERVSTSGLLRVASSPGPAQVSGAETERAVTGVWRGNWTNDVSGGAGTVMLDINDAAGGELSGIGKAEGGKCPRDFSVTGWYRGSLAELTLDLPAMGGSCPAMTVSISIRVGRNNGQLIGVGHWANVIHGRTAGKAFGVLELTKQ